PRAQAQSCLLRSAIPVPRATMGESSGAAPDHVAPRGARSTLFLRRPENTCTPLVVRAWDRLEPPTPRRDVEFPPVALDSGGGETSAPGIGGRGGRDPP